MTAQDDTPLAAMAPLSPSSGLCGGPGQLSCEDANELLQMYLDHVVEPEQESLVAEHLGDCPPCESEAVMYRRIIESLERCRPHVPEDVQARIQRYCTELSSGAHDGDPLPD